MNFPLGLVWTFVAPLRMVLGRSEAAEPAWDSAACVNLVFDGESISVGAGSNDVRGLERPVATARGPNV